MSSAESTYVGAEPLVRFVLIRHGHAPFWSGVERDDDPELSASGIQQCQALGPSLSKLEPTQVVVSPLVRARQTLEQARLPQSWPEPLVAPWLSEILYPPWTGLTQSEIRDALASVMTAAIDRRWGTYGPGGEAIGAFVSRVAEGFLCFLRELRFDIQDTGVSGALSLFRSHDPQTIVLVGHAGSLPVIFGELVGIPRNPWPWDLVRLAHASTTTLHSVAVGDWIAFGIERVSSVDHLPPELRTW